jgi:hypothetical protein
MADTVKHALVLIHAWGDNSELLAMLKHNKHCISVFHIMGRYSFLVDANFDNFEQIESWVNQLKLLKLSSGVPAVIQMQTQRVIDVYKRKSDFTLQQYMAMKDREHFFIQIDSPQEDEGLINELMSSPLAHSVVHVQGESSFTVEVIVDDYDEYRNFLKGLKKFKSLAHIETQEVISVIKYRNQIIDSSGKLVYPDADTRELFSL